MRCGSTARFAASDHGRSLSRTPAGPVRHSHDLPPNPMSRLTLASLRDMGYQVDSGVPESYSLPDLQVISEAGALTSHIAPIDRGIMLPVIPVEVAEDSLQ